MTTANQRIEALEHRIVALEKRLADHELACESGKEKLSEIVDSWQAVILKFADDFGINVLELGGIARVSTKVKTIRR